jgi:nickel/cobalt exporter
VSEELSLLAGAAATIGVVHTLVGPDHYLPFITLAKARRWSLARTVGVTLVSGLGHVAGSVVLGAAGIGLGWALGGVETVETVRGQMAGWMLFAFGLAYFAWGVRRAFRHRPHSHLHAHSDGTVHHHAHRHDTAHGHLHEQPVERSRKFLAGATAWTLFLVFVLGPCEPLIPILMYPAAAGSTAAVIAVATVFALTTLVTMTVAVVAGRAGLALLPDGKWERWSHAAAGGIVAACGLAIQLGL